MTDLGNTVILLLKTLKLRDYACREAEIDQIVYILLLPMMKLISTTKANIPTAVSSAYAGMELISEQNLIAHSKNQRYSGKLANPSGTWSTPNRVQ